MMMWGYSPGWPMMFWMFLWNLFWLVLLGVAVWALVRWVMRLPARDDHQITPPPGTSAMEILRLRYARGEIDTATFEQMRERLEGNRETYPAKNV